MLLTQNKMKPNEINIGQIQKLHSLRIYLEVKEDDLGILVISDIPIKGKKMLD